eukprot:TRINITY_DN10164_c0_g1_i1.p1 TRINITY_DN10164_c0_g1~~TRINITY_DN10164_c0_g1_i1.p1  ORF type:complete len:251 (-),score=66.64 TRINITY_DN10164_c0_g1_i1:314-1066(-)
MGQRGCCEASAGPSPERLAFGEDTVPRGYESKQPRALDSPKAGGFADKSSVTGAAGAAVAGSTAGVPSGNEATSPLPSALAAGNTPKPRPKQKAKTARRSLVLPAHAGEDPASLPEAAEPSAAASSIEKMRGAANAGAAACSGGREAEPSAPAPASPKAAAAASKAVGKAKTKAKAKRVSLAGLAATDERDAQLDEEVTVYQRRTSCVAGERNCRPSIIMDPEALAKMLAGGDADAKNGAYSARRRSCKA